MLDFVRKYSVELFVVYFLFSNAVSTMPTPMPTERLYNWLYGFLHITAANAGRVIPQLRMGYSDRLAGLPYTNAGSVAQEPNPTTSDPTPKESEPPK